MEKTDLTRLNSSSFERMVRALCFREFGPLGTVYSSGPDGARDFTFEGVVPKYEPRQWNGYLVIQAKYFEKADGSPKDISWLINQLKRELAKYEKASEIRKPDYYIIITNISLSGSDGKTSDNKIKKSGYTKINEVLTEWRLKIGLHDFDIWSADKIIDLLAAHPGVRQTYAAWITPGDVLQKLMKQLDAQTCNFLDAINRSLSHFLRRDKYAKLRDAGSVAEPHSIRTSQVFIDLPVKIPSNILIHKLSEDFHSKHKSNLVALIAARAKEKLDPETINDNPDSKSRRKNKIVLLGGPGQGKSTASAFIAQLFRAILIKDTHLSNNDVEANVLISEIFSRAKLEKISLNLPRRYPLLVSLPQYADAISKSKADKNRTPSLLSKISSKIEATCDEQITVRELKNWLAAQPVIFILDGLDEVPPSGERVAVIEAISALMTEAAAINGDALFIVTTRPQGYNNDLSEEFWEHWELQSLDSECAIRYASALGLAHYPNDPDRRSNLLAVLEDASHKAATKRLLESPLQVTILHLILDIGGGIPSARWELFSEYFEVLKKRERAKGGPNQKILERNWSHLGPIHQRAGLILQTDAEHAGAASSSFDKIRFLALLNSYLCNQGFEKIEAKTYSEELYSLAINRLVLLATREEGKITFDVRSLQEFMAAAALTSGDSKLIEKRLLHIAKMAHWRHVFLIAASRVFADDSLHHLRTAVIAIPRSVDSESGEDLLVRNGAKLALEMFVDGIGMDHPLSRKALAKHAFELTQLGPNAMHEKLHLIAEEGTEELIANLLENSINEGGKSSRLASWRLLLKLAKIRGVIFMQLAERLWPQNPCDALEIALTNQNFPPSRNLARQAISSLAACDPIQWLDRLTAYVTTPRVSNKNSAKDLLELLNEQFYSLACLCSRHSIKVKFIVPNNAIELQITKCTDSLKHLQVLNSLPEVHRNWEPLQAAATFGSNPCIQELVAYCKYILENSLLEQAKQLSNFIPWPLGGVMDGCEDEEGLRIAITLAEAGHLGDKQIWIAAEDRWQTKGIVTDDLLYDTTQKIPFDKNIDAIGICFVGRITDISIDNNKCLNLIENLTKIKKKLRNRYMAKNIAALTPLVPIGLSRQTVKSTDMALSILDGADKEHNGWVAYSCLNSLHEDLWNDSNIIEKTKVFALKAYPAEHNALELSWNILYKAIMKNPSKYSYLLPIFSILFFNQHAEPLKIIQAILPKVEYCTANDPRTVLITIDFWTMLLTNNIDDFKPFLNAKLGEDDAALEAEIYFSAANCKSLESNHTKALAAGVIRRLNSIQLNHADRFRELLQRLLDSRMSELPKRWTWITDFCLAEEAYQLLGTKH